KRMVGSQEDAMQEMQPCGRFWSQGFGGNPFTNIVLILERHVTISSALENLKIGMKFPYGQ
ncbi:hypothetical protein KI387_037132, partial [Taxus chinensis]